MKSRISTQRKWSTLPALLVLALAPNLATASGGRTTSVQAAGSMEITLQGRTGEARLVLYPEKVSVTAAPSTYHHAQAAYREEHTYSGPHRGTSRPPARAERRSRDHLAYDGEYVAYHGNGFRAVHGQLIGGKAHGTWRWYDRRGRTIEERVYHHGLLHGTMRVRQSNGRLAEEYEYRSGLLHGRARTWHENGRLATEQHFSNGRLHGTVRTWHPNGRLASERHYFQDRPTGQWSDWNAAGRLTSQERYRG